MLTSQKQAQATIREATGLSRKKCGELVGKLKKVKDGKREKVFERDVEAVIGLYEQQQQPPATRTTKRISGQLAARVVLTGR
jgi:uncharacterized protein YjbJ (UPF0337 family)